MGWSAAQIERVVREVLAELGLETTARTPAGNAPAPRSAESREAAHNAGRPGARAPENAQLVVACRVVTLSELEGRLSGVRRVVVPAGAVVTPAVRDELLRRGVDLSFEAPQAEAGGPLRLVVALAARHFDLAPLSAALRRRGVAVDESRFDCLIAATDHLSRQLAQSDTLGLLLARHTAAALCLANRHATIRAVLGREPVELPADVAAVGANLLVVDPYRVGLSALIRLVQEYCAGGVKQCPEALRERLAPQA